MEKNEHIINAPGYMENVAKGGHLTSAQQIMDWDKGKEQSTINQETDESIAAEVQRATQAEGVLDGKISTEKQRAENVEGGLNDRLGVVEQLAEISVGGGDIGIATATDFDDPTSAQEAKVPTVAAVLGGISDGVFDLTAKTGDSYATLADALTAANTAIPTNKKKGGMSIKFVLTFDNKYVQYFCNSQTFTTDVNAWEKVNLEEEVSQLGYRIDNTLEVYGTIDDGNITPLGLIEAVPSINRNLYSVYCQGFEKVKVSGGDMYGFFSAPPAVGSVTSDSTRHIETLSNTEITIPNGVTYLAVRAETEPTFKLPTEGLEQRVSALEEEIEPIEQKTDAIDVQVNGERYGYSGFSSLSTLVPVTDAYYIPERPLSGKVAAVDIKVGSGNVSILRVTAPQLGGAITYETLTTYSIPSLLENTVVRIPLNIQLGSNEYIGIKGQNSNTWYFGQASGYTLYSNNNSSNGCTAAMVIIEDGIEARVSRLEPIVTENKNDITELQSSVANLEEEVGGVYDLYDNTDILGTEYNHADGYTVCVVPANTFIKTIKMCGKRGISPTLDLAKLDNGYLFRKKSILLAQCAGDNVFIETPIDYLCDEEMYLILHGTFYFRVLDTSINVPYIVSSSVDSEGKYVSQSQGTKDLEYKMQLVCIDTTHDSILGDIEILKNEVMNKDEIPCSDLSMIETMGCCGDSYTAGMIALGPPYVPSNIEYERKNLSWGKVLERHYGIDVSVYAKGAMTVKTYLTDAACLPLLLSESAKKLYAISLGHNDMYLGTTVGDISSLDGDWENYPDNFIGNYGRIIEQIQEHAPNAFIILMRQSKPYCLLNNGAELNQAISDLGVHYGIPVLNPEDDPYLSSNVWTNTMVRRHPIFAGYAGMAMAFARQFNAATVKYWEYFIKYGID